MGKIGGLFKIIHPYNLMDDPWMDANEPNHPSNPPPYRGGWWMIHLDG